MCYNIVMFKENLVNKMHEALYAILPIVLVILVLAFSFIPMPLDVAMKFTVGSIFLVFGMALFSLGVDMALVPLGDSLGAYLGKKKNMILLVAMGLALGFGVTVAEPGLIVLAEQISDIPTLLLVLTVGLGVGIFLALAFARSVLNVNLRYILLFFYVVIFVFIFFVPEGFRPMAFDAGGATTGAMTVPFIMSLGVGLATISNKGADDKSSSFGLVAIASIGPILAIMILGMIYTPAGEFEDIIIPTFYDTAEVWADYMTLLPSQAFDVFITLIPIALFALYAIFSIVTIRQDSKAIGRMCIGLGFTFVGLLMFLLGANVGFLPAGNLLGYYIVYLHYDWLLILSGMIFGFFIITAEPAVYVLNRQVAEVTGGSISRRAMGVALSLGVSASVGISMFRILTGLPIIWIILPAFVISLALSFIVPNVFTAIAFDSGGVASGPLTSAFLLPMAIGASYARGGNIVTDAFGVIALVATTPIITIQIMGLLYVLKSRRLR